MATLETPPNPTSSQQPSLEPDERRPIKVLAGKFGEVDQDELIHLLESYDDEREKGRFRESIYISIILYLALAWLVVWGPRVLFHQGQLVTVKDADHNKISTLDLAKNLVPPRPAPKPLPKLDNRAMDQIRAANAAHAARHTPEAPRPAPSPAPAPAPAAPPPPPVAAAPPPPTPAPSLAPTPMPQPRPAAPSPSVNSIPDAPKPNFTTGQSAGDNIRNAARAAGMRGAGSAIRGETHAVGQQGASGGIEVLSDTENVDFNPYLKHLLAMIKASWYPLIPEECYPPLSKEGTTLIRFTIMPDGRLKIGGMFLDDSTHDRAIDKAAWGSITAIGQFPPLPTEFHGPELTLRIQFIISRNPQPDR